MSRARRYAMGGDSCKRLGRREQVVVDGQGDRQVMTSTADSRSDNSRDARLNVNMNPNASEGNATLSSSYRTICTLVCPAERQERDQQRRQG